MSVEAMAIALHHSRATGSAKIVLLGIANHDGDGGSWPSIGTLAGYANIHPRNADRAVDQLERLGEVVTDTNGGGGRQTAEHMRPNLYRFQLKCPPNCDGTTSHRMLCIVCGKVLPTARKRLLHHNACHPPVIAPPGGEPAGPPPAEAPDEPYGAKPTTDQSVAPVLKREGQAEKDAYGDSELPAGATTHDRCPKRLEAPHAFNKGGVCIDCGARRPARSTGETSA